ncbi:tail fiber protein [Yersinia enterocolitica]|uniref:Tail fiber protein n=1 Tax=Yersinia enterocolitica TaxID=630 RepID=A0ABP1XZ23_YEREN|nr:phage tail protein [Yersinia enterocolitica]CND34206.1 tail fiber protein [Yersinia enterocolitica]CQD63604.1 tail fiber protein [Yersinia enterocolitica]CRX80107.1 tail fiber protein [Yersinia enterocolitica]
MANEILPFGLGAESNVMTQAEYEALAARSGGFSSGVAKSEQLNKVWRQSSFVASVLADFIATQSGNDVLDNGNTAVLLDNLELAIKTYIGNNLPSASLIQKGIVQLSSATNSTSEIFAATPKAVRAVDIASLKIANNLSEINTAGPAAVAATLANLELSDVAHLPQLTGIVGTSRNAKMSITAASATATFTADELIVQTALGGLQYKLSSFNKTINLATTGAGGMDTGTVPATGYVALYAIYNPTSGASALLAVNATSVIAPEVYGGANMPSGYTASALVGAWRVASSQFVIGFQRGRHISIPLTQLWSTATGTTTISGVSLVPAAPANAVSINAYLTLYQTTTSVGVELSLYSTVSGIGQLRANASVSGATSASIANGVLEVVDSQALYFNMASTASGSYAISATGYSI